jgi:hypothetical protein
MPRNLAMITTATALAIGCAGAATASPVLANTGTAGQVRSAAATWTLQPIANPPGASHSHLEGVSCTATASCTAVGNAGSQGTDAPLAQHWNGSSWTQQAVPAPAGSDASVLYGVSCASAASCVAVGSTTPTGIGATIAPLAETWDGSTWTLQSPPAPSGEQGSELTAVSCASATRCTAVGVSFGSSGTTQPLAESWDGTSWTIQPTPVPSATENRLLGVSCSAVNRCTAVGYFSRPRGSSAPLAERWNGTKWSQQPASPGSVSGMLLAVSCASATTCTAVGGATATGGESTLADHWDGSTWTIQPTPGTSGSSFNNLWGVSCPTKTNCTAVGYYMNGTGATITKADHWNGTVWAPQLTAAPKGGKVLTGVSCATAGRCTASGYFLNVGGQTPNPWPSSASLAGRPGPAAGDRACEGVESWSPFGKTAFLRHVRPGRPAGPHLP